MVSKMEGNDVSEELDYHITFPSPTPESDYDSDEEEEIREVISVTQREPVVILLGWMGGVDKHLAKYSAVYDQKKCITIRYTVSAERVFYKQSTLHPMAVRILEMIEDLSLEDSPILFHVMSNGGCLVYAHITEILHTDPHFSHLKVRGCVFDSCPGQRRVASGIRAFFSNLKINTILAYLVTFVFAIYMYTRVLVAVVLEKVGQSTGSVDDFFKRMADDPSRWPQLYLYSMADKLINYQDVDKMINVRRSKGVLVMSICWEDSEHVSHLRQHRETYMKQCHDFLDLCLSVENSMEI